MNFVSVIAVTEEVARKEASTKTGYAPETIGRVSLVIDEGNNSRQIAFVFETSQDVTRHPLYAKATLAEALDLAGKGVSDGPVLQFGPEVTVGG
ncbi:hypothetical protein [Aminobacter carboxidus]|uniref:Uncharacterized protein n=1 Tax=Aminobacter carboxidus TaxID=376165 RepID=A0ABR9GQJ9_9HYPH|nr:hypothetical protein [Aminobacter carboxidus]MBE1205942.1 hypothetical protein [Aminobacter carboxidus]